MTLLTALVAVAAFPRANATSVRSASRPAVATAATTSVATITAPAVVGRPATRWPPISTAPGPTWPSTTTTTSPPGVVVFPTWPPPPGEYLLFELDPTTGPGGEWGLSGLLPGLMNVSIPGCSVVEIWTWDSPAWRVQVAPGCTNRNGTAVCNFVRAATGQLAWLPVGLLGRATAFTGGF